MSEPNTYDVTFEEQEDGPDAALRERFAVIASRRMGAMDEKEGYYPAAGSDYDIHDNFSGKYIWELTPEELESNPPSAIYLELVSVDPAERPETPGTVKVVARVAL